DAALRVSALELSPLRGVEPAIARLTRRLAPLLAAQLPFGRGTRRVSGVPRAEAAGPGGAGQDPEARRALAPARGRSGADLRLRQRDRLPDRPPVPDPGHHPPDENEGTPAHPPAFPCG